MIKNHHVRIVCETPNPNTEYRTIQTDTDFLDGAGLECPSHPGGDVRDFVTESIADTVSTAIATGMDVDINCGSVISETYNAVNDAVEIKQFRFSIVRDDMSGLLEALVETKTTGAFAGVPVDHSLEVIIVTLECAAGGSTLSEV